MARPSRFSEAKILDAAAGLVARGGPGAATIGAIGAAIDAPWGSIYHRFPSRHALLGRLWLGKAAEFQDRFVAALADADPLAAGRDAALSLPRSARADFVGARILLLHRRDDFFADEWPAEMRREAARLGRQVEEALADITRRLFKRVTPETLRLATLAVLDLPFAATRRHVAANERPPIYVDELIACAYGALLRSKPGRQAKRRPSQKWLE
ncbi:MAG TPA: TetR family transcriptional regulator [Stellaceae bacterium]|nr:TetR family transcriptional regulator [Stellaceae bacterium]